MMMMMDSTSLATILVEHQKEHAHGKSRRRQHTHTHTHEHFHCSTSQEVRMLKHKQIENRIGVMERFSCLLLVLRIFLSHLLKILESFH